MLHSSRRWGPDSKWVFQTQRYGLQLYLPWLKFWITSWYSHFKLSKKPLYVCPSFFFQFLLITDMVNLTTKYNHHIVQLANYEVIRVASQEHGPLKFRLTTKKSIPAHALVKSWTSEQSHIHTIIYLLYNSVVGKRSPKDPMKALWELWASWASIPPYSLYILMSLVFSTTW